MDIVLDVKGCLNQELWEMSGTYPMTMVILECPKVQVVVTFRFSASLIVAVSAVYCLQAVPNSCMNDH